MIEGRIIPRLQRLYDYDVDQPDDRHIIFINLPLPKKPDFDISKINVQLETVENDEDAINIGIEGEMPFVCGVLYHPVNKEYEKEKARTNPQRDPFGNQYNEKECFRTCNKTK